MSEQQASETSKDSKWTYSIAISLADDYYSAFLSLLVHKPVSERSDFTEEELTVFRSEIGKDIKERLSRINVVYGILNDEIDKAISELRSVEGIVIARGVPHVNGIDSTITYHVNFDGKSKPVVLEDGTVDFKNIQMSCAVKKDMCLASKVPVTLGSDGISVTGKAIKHKLGKDSNWKFGENVYEDPSGLMLLAQEDGIAKNANNRITVLRVIELKEVGPESGNIYFGGDVHVKENVLDGYTIECDGDLTIDGIVEGCIIKVKGNLTVSKGILGHGTSDIVVGGNLVTKFIENANVYVKGEIETGEIINSKVLCDSKILVKGKKGLIIGGEITSKFMIEANHIGSRLGVLTTINLGVDASVIVEVKQLKEAVQELKLLEARLIARIPVLKDNALRQPEIEIHSDILDQEEKSLMTTQVSIEEKSERLNHLMDALKNANQGKVKINSIFPDTMIRIGNAKYFVDKALSACIISKADDQVVAIGIKEDKL